MRDFYKKKAAEKNSYESKENCMIFCNLWFIFWVHNFEQIQFDLRWRYHFSVFF